MMVVVKQLLYCGIISDVVKHVVLYHGEVIIL